ncbi:MAG: FHA domain-containing protein, partial [Deltaproteobacteria bacterium]|nr:FHA domain-containing protein [Deltaproteobacteria bacterium]
MAVKLTVTPPGAGPGAPEFSFTFDQEKIVVGRGASADVLLPSASVSDTHCVIRLEGQDYVIFDPGSTNGTKHNGQPLVEGRRKLLRSGDVIEVVGFQICFRAGLAMEGIHTADRTAALARRMVREALDTLGPGGEPPHLTFLNGSRAGDRVPIPDHPEGLTVGRDVDCEVRLDDSDSSRRHAVVRRSWEGTFVTDLGSKNGTLVNEERVRGDRRLKDRDEILFGATRVVFEDPAEAFLRELELVEKDAAPPEPPPAPPAPSEGARAPITASIKVEVVAPPGGFGPIADPGDVRGISGAGPAGPQVETAAPPEPPAVENLPGAAPQAPAPSPTRPPRVSRAGD